VTGRSGRGTPRQTIRIDEDLWTRFGELAAAQGLDRSALLRQFIRWYLRLPDGTIPHRPS
jgi:predicted transcriptional regulator